MATTIPKEVFLQYKRKTKRNVVLFLLPIFLFLLCLACFGVFQFYQLTQRMKKLEKMIQKHGKGLIEDNYDHHIGFQNNEVVKLSNEVRILQKQYKDLEKQSQLILSEFSKRLNDLKERTDEEKQQFFSDFNLRLEETRKEVRKMLDYRNSNDLDHDRNMAGALKSIEDKFSRTNETLRTYIVDKIQNLTRDQEEKHKVYQQYFDKNISFLLSAIDNLNNTRLIMVEEFGRGNQTSWRLEEDVRMMKGRDSCVKIEDFHATEAYLEGKIDELSRQVRKLASLSKAKEESDSGSKLSERDEFGSSFLNALDELGFLLQSLR